MNENLIVTAVLLATGIGGILLARTILVPRRTGPGLNEQPPDASLSKFGAEFEACYNECMAVGLWDPKEGDACNSICRSRVDLHL